MTVDEAKRALTRFIETPGLPSAVRDSFEGVLAVVMKQQRRIKNQARELTALKEGRKDAKRLKLKTPE